MKLQLRFIFRFFLLRGGGSGSLLKFNKNIPNYRNFRKNRLLIKMYFFGNRNLINGLPSYSETFGVEHFRNILREICYHFSLQRLAKIFVSVKGRDFS